jgi:DNA (cytosine-5)-methyltransferase 1
MKEDRYDLIIGNPPYVKLKSAEITKYLGKYNFGKMTNLFGMFMEKAKTMADEIALVIPKTFLMTPEFNSLRDYYQNNFGVVSITDYGVHYFKDVFVEIITIYFKKNYKRPIIVENKLDNSSRHVPPGYIYHDKHWLIYRNEWFDKFINKMKLDMFDFFRDRQITNKYLAESGKIRVLKSKNILDDGSIVEIDGYDKFVDDIDSFSIKKFFNTKNIIMPNFTYNTRATIMPKNTIPNGSIAVFLLKNYDYNIDDIDLSFYATPDFRKYYAIVKNNSKFTINIDANSIYYIGVKV